VQRAYDEELAEHHRILAGIDKESKGVRLDAQGSYRAIGSTPIYPLRKHKGQSGN